MLTDFVEIPNVLDNIDELVMLAKQQMFVKKEVHYHNTDRKTHYNGIRSRTLIDIDKDMYEKVMNKIFQSVCDKRFDNEVTQVRYNFAYTCSAYFHIMSEGDKFNESWLHKDDSSVLAGLIYLNPNPQPNSGTIIYKNGEKVTVKNEYNKLVMYDPTYTHAPEAGFGTDINDCRLTMVFFVGDFQFMVESKKDEEENK